MRHAILVSLVLVACSDAESTAVPQEQPADCTTIGLDGDGYCIDPETAERTVTMCGPDSDDVYMLCRAD